MLKIGKSGTSEGSYLLTAALTVCGLFVFGSYDAYSGGNSSYIWLPVGCLLAFLLAALCIFALKKTHTEDLAELAEYSIGKVFSRTLALILSALMVTFAALLSNRFLNVMHGYFFYESSVYSVALYFFAVPLILACTGYEVIGRTAKVCGVIFIVFHVLLLFNSRSGYELYKLYPIAGDGLLSVISGSLRSVGLFLPVFIALLSCAGGYNDKKTVAVVSLRGTAAAAVLCAVTQLLIALSATYDELAGLYMPLYRMSMVTGEENFILRLDKICIFLWTASALLTCAYRFSGASNLFCRAFKQKDSRPSAAVFSLTSVMLCLILHSGRYSSISADNIISYGALIAAVLLSVTSVTGIIRSIPNAIRRKKI